MKGTAVGKKKARSDVAADGEEKLKQRELLMERRKLDEVDLQEERRKPENE